MRTSYIPKRIDASVPRVLLNNQLVGAFRDTKWGCGGEMRNSYNNLPILGDCQNLVLTLIELCGWREDYETMIEVYKAQHHIQHILWEDTYNFDRIEDHLWSFERDFQKQKDDEDDDEDTPQKEEEVTIEEGGDDGSLFGYLRMNPFLRHCVQRDDGRVLPEYSTDKECVARATTYFVKHISRGKVNNSFVSDPGNSSDRIVVRFENVLLTLNSVNSRCFRELLKWTPKEYSDYYFLYRVCGKQSKRCRHEGSVSSSFSTCQRRSQPTQISCSPMTKSTCQSVACTPCPPGTCAGGESTWARSRSKRHARAPFLPSDHPLWERGPAGPATDDSGSTSPYR